MKRPEPNYPRRSSDGIARHSRKRHVRGAYLDPRPRSAAAPKKAGRS